MNEKRKRVFILVLRVAVSIFSLYSSYVKCSVGAQHYGRKRSNPDNPVPQRDDIITALKNPPFV
jgi:hypothetical protein